MMNRWTTADEFPGSISLPFGIKTSHTWHEIGQILRIVNDLNITTFIELGTHVGGLASLLSCIGGYRPFEYYGYDINTSWVDPAVAHLIDNRDVLSDLTREEITDRLYGRSMIYCDGGNKVAEMNFYADILKTGDVIACHDYYDGQKVVGLKNFGVTDECGCVPEVRKSDLSKFTGWKPLPEYLLEGTRIAGYERL